MPRRTKACAICRKKRIKCDATMPHCTMCIKFGRQCPGPTDAPLLFIDNSDYPSGKRPKKSRAAATAEGDGSHQPLAQIHHQPPPRPLPLPLPEENSELPYELAFDLSVRVSPRYVLHEAFYSNLVRFFCAEGRELPGAPRRVPTWLHVLPRLVSNQASAFDKHGKESPTRQPLSFALRALTAAFTGIETKNSSLVEYASRLYGSALRGQGNVLAAEEEGSRVRRGLSELEMLSTSILLGMFEAVVATTTSAYADHILGSAKMVARILRKLPKPEGRVLDQPPPKTPVMANEIPQGRLPGEGRGAFSEPLPTGLFFHVRFQLTFVYLTTTSERLRQDDIIVTVLEDACGWQIDRLPLMQRLLRPVARLATLLNNPDFSDWQRQWAFESVSNELDQLAKEFGRTEKQQKLKWANPQTGQTEFRDPFTALTYAYFAACWALLHLASPPEGGSRGTTPHLPVRTHSPSTPPQPVSQESTLPPNPALPSTKPCPPSTSSSPPSQSSTPYSTVEHHDLILSVAWYLRLRDVGFSYLRLHTPLFVTAMYAPKVEQRLVARMIFEEWKTGALRGIGELAIKKLDVEGTQKPVRV